MGLGSYNRDQLPSKLYDSLFPIAGSLSPLQYSPSSALLFLSGLTLQWSSSDANCCALLPFYAQQWRFGNF